MKFTELPSHIGYCLDRVPDNIVEMLNQDIEEAITTKKNPAQNNLAGNIVSEYYLRDNKEIDQYIMHIAQHAIDNMPVYTNYVNGISHSTTIPELNTPYKLIHETRWVNIQQRYEFNPKHSHSGFLSYVIWLKIPYSKEDEIRIGPGGMSNTESAGDFDFLYTDGFGSVTNHRIVVDKHTQPTICVFPSSLNHTVYPFFSTNESRVTVAGNIAMTRKRV